MALLTGFAGAIFGAMVIGIFGALAGADFSDPPPAVNIIATVFQDVALVVSAVVFARMAGTVRPAYFGLRRPRALKPALAWIAAAYGSFFVLSAIWIAILQIKSKDQLPDELGVDKSTVALLAVAFLVAVVAPLAEEFFFRGFFFSALRNWHGVWPAAIVTGLVFGGIHAGSSPVGFLVPLAFFGILLCLLYERTGSLYPCIGLHCLNNSVAFGVAEKWDWQIPVLLVVALALITAALRPVSDRQPRLA
jgi:membrane protease YdiL (CAAX protease family)